MRQNFDSSWRLQCSSVSAAAESAEITTTLMTTCGLDTRISA